MTTIYKIFSKTIISFFIFTLSMSVFSQKYETHNYETLFSDDSFEVRLYDSVLKAKTSSTKGSNNNFGKLFRYISGYNQKNEKISMTTPVYMNDEDKGSMMEFVLPSKFDKVISFKSESTSINSGACDPTFGISPLVLILFP